MAQFENLAMDEIVGRRVRTRHRIVTAATVISLSIQSRVQCVFSVEVPGVLMCLARNFNPFLLLRRTSTFLVDSFLLCVLLVFSHCRMRPMP